MPESYDLEKNLLEKNSVEIGEQVRAQYEGYPYPPVPVEQKVSGLSIVSNYVLAQYARTRRFHSPVGKRALVAGCGTGHELHMVAANNPELDEVIGIDFSSRSIEIANERIRHHKLSNCKAYVADLLASETLPKGPFDFITSYGVLHHLADPSLGLSNLSSRLASDGIIGMMLYNKAGRWKLHQIRKALKLLGIEETSSNEAISFIRDIMQQASPGTLISQVYFGEENKRYYSHDENIVDNFLHPNDLPFNVGDLPDYLDKAGMDFVDIADLGFLWSPENVIPLTYGKFHEKLRKLSRVDCLSVLEGLNPTAHTQNIFWACHKGKLLERISFSESFFIANSWLVNPAFVKYAHIEYHEDDRLEGRERGKATVGWPLFKTHSSKVELPSFIIDDMLTLLAVQPVSGAEIVQHFSRNEVPRLIQWLEFLEEARIILCQ